MCCLSMLRDEISLTQPCEEVGIHRVHFGETQRTEKSVKQYRILISNQNSEHIGT